MKVHHYVNPHRHSNSYVLELAEDIVVLVDLGDFNTKPFLDWMQENGKRLSHVILTHEHADHCCGVDALGAQVPFQLICSAKCEVNIRNSRQNFSFYLEEIPTFEIDYQDVLIVRDGETLVIGGYEFYFTETPGHSPGSICIKVEDFVFTGDTVLNGVKSPLSFPHSNREAYQLSVQKIREILTDGMTIFPGHDSSFEFKGFEELSV